ncbi:MAG: hypothetical protein PHT15_08830 [Gallionellaceae bacterium]|nr:hypothetical protein [Gallionellaceae bacterium]
MSTAEVTDLDQSAISDCHDKSPHDKNIKTLIAVWMSGVLIALATTVSLATAPLLI